MSALETLARVARRKAEEIERELSAIESRRLLLARRLDAHDASVADEQATAAGSLDAAIAFGAYAHLALGRRRILVAEHEALAAESDALRDSLRDAFVELKKIETLIDQEADRNAIEDNRREQAQMDDLAANMARNRR
jgi:flagellar export protein FliJ